jgi:hypothetical protein
MMNRSVTYPVAWRTGGWQGADAPGNVCCLEEFVDPFAGLNAAHAMNLSRRCSEGYRAPFAALGST